MAFNAYKREVDSTHLTNGMTLKAYEEKGDFTYLIWGSGFEHLTEKYGSECL